MTIYKKIISITSEQLKEILGLDEDVFITGVDTDYKNDRIYITCQSTERKDSGFYEVWTGGAIPHQYLEHHLNKTSVNKLDENAKEENN